MGDDQVELAGRWRPRRDVLLKEANTLRVGPDLFPRKGKHAFARINAIDFDVAMRPKQFGQKATVPLAQDQYPARGTDRIETNGARALQGVTEGDRLECPIPG